MTKSTLIPEPKLFFGDGQADPDPKIGLLNFGPYGSEVEDDNPCVIRAGVIGTKQSILELRNWLEKLRTRIPGELDAVTNLREPDFPGLGTKTPLKFDIQIDDSCIEEIPLEDISRLTEIPERKKRIIRTMEIYEQKFKDLAETTHPKPEVVLLPISSKLIASCKDKQFKTDHIVYERRTFKKQNMNEEIPLFDFHNAMKIIAFKHGGFTTQLLLPHTLEFGRGTQDPATIGWNFAVSTYYKATGTPWKLADIDDETCYVGIAFYQEISNLQRNMRASMAQVYLRTGESQVIRGKPFKWEGQGISPKLGKEQARAILTDVIDLYKRQKKGNNPKRIVIHKTSPFNEEEMQGFDEASKDVEMRDYVHIMESTGVMMLPDREQYPAIRGTFVYNQNEGLLYTTGFIPAQGTYKGASVPSPIMLRVQRMGTNAEQIAKDIMALTKLDWNNSNFNTCMPVTISVARKVGDILSESSAQKVDLPTNYRFFM